MANVTKISDFTRIDSGNNCIEFARNGKVFIKDESEIDFSHFTKEAECLSETWQSLIVEIADYYHHFNKALDITVEYLEDLAEKANPQPVPVIPTIKSTLFSNAWAKWKNGIKNFSICLKDAWNDLKITAAIVVQFVKQEDLELENPPIQTRFVKFISRLADGRFLYQDTQNPIKKVSFYSYQVHSWE